MSITIPIKKGQMNFVSPPSYVQLALEVESKEAIPTIVNYLSKSVAALHLRLKDENTFEFNKDKLIHYYLPTNNMTIQEAGHFCLDNLTPESDEAFGCIATNDHQVVLNASHRFCDGGFFKFLMDHFPNAPKEQPIIPRFTNDLFRDQIKNAPDGFIPYPYDTELSRIHPKSLPLNQSHKFIKLQYIRLNANEYKNYNPQKNAPDKITETNWMAIYFASSCYEGKLFKNFKVPTVNDLRRFILPKGTKPDFLNGYHCAHVAPIARNISPDEKIIDVAKRIKTNLIQMQNDNILFSTFKPDTNHPIVPGFHVGYSGIGQIKIKRPIIDANVSIRMFAGKSDDVKSAAGGLSTFCWSVDNGKGSNRFVTQLGYSPNQINEEEVKLYSKRIEYFFRNITLDRKIGDVFEEIKKVH